jgi:uracil-DNA glycosylase
VLLLNSVLSVEAKKAASHQNQGWETFTDAIIQKLSDEEEQIIFILWGNFAKKKSSLIDESKHVIISSPHPSPLSAYRGFFNSKPFSRCNRQLKEWKLEPIDWRL